MSEATDMYSEAFTNPDLNTPDWNDEAPTAWVRLQFPIGTMEEPEKAKVLQAMSLLKEAGLSFDTGFGGGVMDWEWDWSLHGAVATVRTFRCMALRCDLDNFPLAYWAHYTDATFGNRVSSRVYCSAEHRTQGIESTERTFWCCEFPSCPTSTVTSDGDEPKSCEHEGAGDYQRYRLLSVDESPCMTLKPNKHK